MSFSDEIAAFAKKAEGNADIVTRKTVLDIGTRLVNRTPVGDASFWQSKPPPGYTGGHARANWSHSIGKLNKKEFDVIDPSGAASMTRIISSVPVKAGGKDHFIQNSVPYIIPLEDGHSRQAPHGMAAITAVEFQGIVNGITKGMK
ncbi:hypothetical protein KAR91_26115 [Candidatus Pacearchaeota archaeon]|nr:hypothetical protein [Candidatus Pacearchaeota archaeon]